MRTIILSLFMVGMGLAQINGQTASAGETAPFSIGFIKVPALTATPSCAAPKDTLSGKYQLVAGGSTTCTITLNKAAPAAGATITLTSIDPTNFTVPASVLIPSGSTSGTFQVTATP